jgi:hypothetical protein
MNMKDRLRKLELQLGNKDLPPMVIQQQYPDGRLEPSDEELARIEEESWERHKAPPFVIRAVCSEEV